MITMLQTLGKNKLKSRLLWGMATALLVVALLPSTAALRAQTPCACGDIGTKSSVTNTGQEFLLCFDQNELPDYTTDSYQSIFLASLSDSAVVTITSKQYPSYSKVIKLGPNSSLTYRISDDVDPLINSDEVVDKTVIHVLSTAPIVCYGFNHKQYTTDAFLALPRNTAETDYRIMSYYNSSLNINNVSYQSEFSVAAFNDNTQVTITPTALTAGGRAAGVPQSYTLNAGECVQIQADEHTQMLDMTGSHITSSDKIVVYGAHVRAEVPVGYQALNSAATRNTLCEQIPPITTWGKAFVCTNFEGRSAGDIARIQALNDNTVITINGTIARTLNADQWFDTLITSTIAIQTSQPALTGMIAHSASTAPNGLGDPFFAIAPPLDETYTDFTFFTSDDPAFSANVVVIVTEQSGVGRITLDGQVVPASSFSPIATPLNGANWSIAQVVLSTPGGHRITSTNGAAQGFTILAYGLGPVDAYGYTAGALLKPLRALFASSGGQRGIVQGSTMPNVVNIRNILSNRVYLDSSRIILDGDAGKYYSAKFDQDVASDIGHIEMAGDANLTIRVNPPLTAPIGATVKVYTHTAQWFDLEPTEVHVTIVPEAAAGVADKNFAGANAFVQNYPNPFSDKTTISFNLRSRADISLKVYDDLGRLVSTILDEEIAAGPYAIRFEPKGLSNGHYFYELKSAKLNISERHSLLIVH